MPLPSTSATPRRVGVISNPRSHANRNGRSGLGELIARSPELAFAEPATPAALDDALRRFASRKIDLVVVSGGDGTLRDVLTALPGAYPDQLPDLAILAAGNTNLAARTLGIAGAGPRALQRLLDAARLGRLRRSVRPFLEIRWIGEPERPPVRGFFFGAAAFADGKRMADTEIHRRSFHKGTAVALTAATMVLRLLFGDPGHLRRGTPMRIGLDDGRLHEAPRFLLLATTLDRLMLGLWPFWSRDAAVPEARLHWLDIEAPPARLIPALLAMALRRPQGWMAGKGYRSGDARRMRILLDQPFVLDGEFFDPGRGGILLTSPGDVTLVAA